ncbi:MAG: MFS transporter [Syntrophales bacterium]|nr:MFS transporter [Syntrophales bacterium]
MAARLKIFYGWWVVLSCFFIGFLVSGVIFYGFTAFFEPLVKEFGWSHTQVSFASSLRGMEMGILAPLVGFLADCLGSRMLLVAGMTTLGAGLILLSYTQSLPMFYGAMVLIAFGGGGCASVVTMTAVSQWFRKNIGKALAVMTSGFGASGLMLPAIVALIDTYGWRTAVVILGLSMWILGIPLALIIRDSPEKYGETPDGIPLSKAVAVQDPHEGSPKRSYRAMLKDRPFLYLNLAEAIRFMALTSVVIHIMPHLSMIGIPRTQAGLIAASIPILSIAGRFVFGWLGDLFDKRRVTVFAFGLMALGMFCLAFIHIKVMLILFLLLFPFGFGGITVLRATILREYYDKKAFGSMMGIMMGFAAAGGIIGPTFTGWVFDMSKDYSFVWMGFSVMLLVSIQCIRNFRPQVPAPIIGIESESPVVQ